MIRREHEDTAGLRSGAIFSDCERYRYRLWREWEPALPTLAFLLLNPSTADERVNDPTIERCQRRAVTWGYGRLEIVNLFPLRVPCRAIRSSSTPNRWSEANWPGSGRSTPTTARCGAIGNGRLA